MSRYVNQFIKDFIRFLEGKEPKHLRVYKVVGNNRKEGKKFIRVCNNLELIKNVKR